MSIVLEKFAGQKHDILKKSSETVENQAKALDKK